MSRRVDGNIRVYCRIRPAFRIDTRNMIDFIGEDGSLVLLDPLKGIRETHTMCGPSGVSQKDLGINYLAMNDLFDVSNTRKGVVKYELFLMIRSCTSENGLSLPDATMLHVKSTIDVLNLMKSGQVNRAISSTILNEQSMRVFGIMYYYISAYVEQPVYSVYGWAVSLLFFT
ncbi:kinesin-like protein KIN-14L [Tanacetum coccineum]